MGSPPPAGSKKAVFRFRSVKSIVIAPARTGRDRISRRAVIPVAQINRGIRSNCRPFHRMLTIVVMKFRDPRMDDTPAR